ncbi:hypothetical protein ElyMa_005719300 [Elysia marginata]|uniref:Uncharacterized protein n=1 Tax=Elysia marginata TaxID=1093978 RepID=A0AAV4FIV7_9GAST|nr:hypothetical protein ElyMa_005719300 [Elysia marginata]
MNLIKSLRVIPHEQWLVHISPQETFCNRKSFVDILNADDDGGGGGGGGDDDDDDDDDDDEYDDDDNDDEYDDDDNDDDELGLQQKLTLPYHTLAAVCILFCKSVVISLNLQ